MNDLDYMMVARDLALKGRRSVSPNPMVGCVIVKNGQIIGTGFHRRAGGPHAEIEALKNAKGSVSGATMYVTLEPCHHWGRTPPCVDAVIASGIKKVVVGMRDPNPLTNGRSLKKLKRAGLQVVCGVGEQGFQWMNEPFVKFVTTGMPFVVAKIAQTIDGKIATASGQSKWITSAATRTYARKVRADFDAIVVGINTVLADDPRLTTPGKKLLRIILDSSLKVPLNAKALSAPCLVATTKKADRAKIGALTKRGVDVVVIASKNGKVDLRVLFAMLAKRGVAKILIEGGGQVIGSALKDKLVDKMMIYIAPKILGDAGARVSVDGLGTRRLDEAVRILSMTTRVLGDDLLLEGDVA